MGVEVEAVSSVIESVTPWLKPAAAPLLRPVVPQPDCGVTVEIAGLRVIRPAMPSPSEPELQPDGLPLGSLKSYDELPELQAAEGPSVAEEFTDQPVAESELNTLIRCVLVPNVPLTAWQEVRTVVPGIPNDGDGTTVSLALTISISSAPSAIVMVA